MEWNWTPELVLSVSTLVAVLLGPILAVLVTRYIDEKRAARSRKMEIFRTLMKTRRSTLHFEHVTALNLVEIEFADKPKVVAAWKAYLKNLGTRAPSDDELGMQEQFYKDRDSLLTKLIHQIAQSLRFKVEQLDILEGNYSPQGWHDEEWEQKVVRRQLMQVLSGQSPLVVHSVVPQIEKLQAADSSDELPEAEPKAVGE